MKSRPSPLIPVGLPVRMIEPPPCASIERIACLIVRNVPVRLMSIVRRHTSSSRSAASASWPKSCTPALATTTSGAHPAPSSVGERVCDRLLVRDVHQCGTSGIADRRDGPSRGIRISVGDDDPRALAREALRHRETDAGARTRDERGLSLSRVISVPQRSMRSRCSMRARFLSSSSSRKIFFQSSLMMLSRP